MAISLTLNLRPLISESIADQYIWMVEHFSTEGHWHHSGCDAGDVKRVKEDNSVLRNFH